MPEIKIENIWSNDFSVSTFPVLIFNKVDESVVNTGPVGKPEGRSGR